MTTHTLPLPEPLARLAIEYGVVLVPWKSQPRLQDTVTGEYKVWIDPSDEEVFWVDGDDEALLELSEALRPYQPGDILTVQWDTYEDSGYDLIGQPRIGVRADLHTVDLGPVATVDLGPVAAVEVMETDPTRFLSDPLSFSIGAALEDAYIDDIPEWWWLIRMEAGG